MGHDHDHGVAGGTGDDRRLIAGVLTITVVVLIAEVVGAVITGSLALIADAGHVLTDVVGLIMALTAAQLVLRPATTRLTWGHRRAETLAAALQALLLLGVGIFVLVEGIRRLIEPPEVASGAMVIFGVVGLVGNIVCITLLFRRRAGNLNLRAAFLEVLNDALGSVAVIVAAIVIMITGWSRADAICSLLIAALILPRTVSLLRDAARVLMESTPTGLDLDAVRRHILEVPHVREVHDLHASQIATGLPVLSAHVVVDEGCFHDGHIPRLLDDLQGCVARHFAISVEHSTFQFEPAGHAEHEPGRH